jgi:hypothetical protein
MQSIKLSSLTFPIAPMPTIPSVRPDGSRTGGRPFRHLPWPMLFCRAKKFLRVPRMKKIARSAVASFTALRLLQNKMPFLVIHSTSNSLKPADADTMSLQ